ncbi:hypothetical protein NAU58_17995 [Pseudomonas stutzeri]|uniref:Uncharacterized protein n=1 Tax=Stutzerimonas stutzeri TaxID=316 RepID=A0A2N8RZ15_STUST|nr:hypothetical protein [Stutzerimonas stutzeri]MCQ4297473.1 hypothetical protein [Stutzerimonas stutzeri]PNF79611.1 hypothetical protein CXK92_13250 [Stutzerimonas stutzeri]
MTTSAAQQAIGALKLTSLYLDHPSVVAAGVLRGACDDAIARLRLDHPCADDLGRLWCALFDVLPLGYLPHVTLNKDPTAPFACFITDGAGNVVDRQAGKTIAGITELIRLRLPAGRGEAQP